MVRHRMRVVKVGGSLLDWPPLGAALRWWLAHQPPAGNVLVCGGGVWCDALREAQQRFGLSEPAMHWLCVEALAVTAGLLSEVLGVGPPLRDWRRLRQEADRQVQQGKGRDIVFDPRAFLREDEPNLPGTRLPHDWSVTSDAIAARLAAVLQADELVLLKSADPPAQDLAALAACGYVDRHLARAADEAPPLRLVNLRGAWAQRPGG